MAMNPQIQTVGIGVKEVQKITIYPLSMADQFELSDIIADAIVKYGEAEDVSEVQAFNIIMSTIQENLIIILDLITEEKNQITLADLTNDQFAELCDIIYTVNYGSAMGKLQALFQRAKKAFRLNLPSQKSSQEQVTDTNISTDSHTEMGE